MAAATLAACDALSAQRTKRELLIRVQQTRAAPSGVDGLALDAGIASQPSKGQRLSS
jgi:hypothetical protein